jgi:hypothetical protein
MKRLILLVTVLAAGLATQQAPAATTAATCASEHTFLYSAAFDNWDTHTSRANAAWDAELWGQAVRWARAVEADTQALPVTCSSTYRWWKKNMTLSATAFRRAVQYRQYGDLDQAIHWMKLSTYYLKLIKTDG